MWGGSLDRGQVAERSERFLAEGMAKLDLQAGKKQA